MAETTDKGKKSGRGLSRRNAMLVTGAAVAGAGALIAAPFRDQIRSTARRALVNTRVGRGFLSLADGNYEEWLGEVGATFSLGGRTNIRLVGVRALPSPGVKPQGVRAQAFAAFFDPVANRSVAPDLIYTATHSAYGPLPLFLSSASSARTPGRMVAVSAEVMPPPVREAASFGIAYRDMTDEDLPFVAALYASTRAEEVATTGWPVEMQAAFLDQQHRAQHSHYRTVHPDGEWLVIERQGQPVGRLYLAEMEGSLLVVDISLLPDARGSGLGTAILTDLLADEPRPVTLHVERHNPARRLYERMGFAVVHDDGLYLRMVHPC